MERFDKSKNVTPDLYACDMENRQTTQKWPFGAKSSPYGQILRILQLRFNRAQ